MRSLPEIRPSPNAAVPALSVVLITPDTFSTVRRTCEHLAAQTIASQIELLLCAPSQADLEADPRLLAAFASVAVIETGDCRVVARVKAMASRRAGASCIAFIEEHAFPQRQYAERLLARLHEGCAAAGPLMVNANPKLAASWANFVIEYGPWSGWTQARAFGHLPGNNGSYRREALLSFGDRLEALLDAESLLHWELGKRGETLQHEPLARVHHVNITAFRPFGLVHFYYARMFAAARAARWPLARRLAYALGGGLIPIIRFRRHWPDIRRIVPASARTISFWSMFAFGLVLAAAGEAVGYLSGAGPSRERIYWLEFHRPRYLAKNDEWRA